MGEKGPNLPEHTSWSTPPPQDEAHRTRPSETLLPAEQPMAGPGEEPGTQASDRHANRPSAGALSLTLLLALIGFSAMAAGIHWIVRRPLYLFADFRSGKLELMQQWRGHAFSASFGSSHVHNGFDPRSFDTTLAGTPLQTRSINLAVAGGSQTEQRAMALAFVRQLKAPPPSSHESCLVLLELTAGANFTPDHLIHPRAIDIYDLQALRFVSRLTAPRMPLLQRAGRVGFAVIATLLHYINLGTLSNSLLPHLQPDSLYEAETKADRRGAFLMTSSPLRKQRLKAEVDHAPPHPTVAAGELLPGNYDLIRQLELSSAVPGVRFVYVVMPKLTDLYREEIFPDSIEVNGQLVPIIDLARPDLYPQLYEPSQWFDDAHFDDDGAQRASVLIARSLATFFTSHPLNTACGG